MYVKKIDIDAILWLLIIAKLNFFVITTQHDKL